MQNRPSARIVLGLLALGCAALFGYFVWPTPWDYHVFRDSMIRIDRRSGRVEGFSPDSGWVSVRKKADPFDDIAHILLRDTTDPLRKFGDVPVLPSKP